MDSTVIQEIANQLGMAVDQAGAFIQEQLPQFAALKAMQSTIPIIATWVIFGVLVIIGISAVIIYAVFNKRLKYEVESALFEVILASLTLSGIMILIAIVTTAFCVPNIIGWSEYPQAMLIDMALKAV